MKWRLPLGEAGILDFYLVILRAEAQTQRLSTALKIQILRLIGNSSADTSKFFPILCLDVKFIVSL